MAAATIDCPRCKLPLRLAAGDVSQASCTRCHKPYRLAVFPALFREVAGRDAQRLLDQAEASCFYHEDKKAEVACDHCGRFLCGLCDIELEGDHLCPNCLESGRRKGKIESLQNRSVLYDEVALYVAVLPLVLYPLTFFTFMTAPVAIGLAIYYWGKVQTPLPRGKWRFVLAIVLAILQLAGWTLLIGALITEIT